ESSCTTGSSATSGAKASPVGTGVSGPTSNLLSISRDSLIVMGWLYQARVNRASGRLRSDLPAGKVTGGSGHTLVVGRRSGSGDNCRRPRRRGRVLRSRGGDQTRRGGIRRPRRRRTGLRRGRHVARQLLPGRRLRRPVPPVLVL